MAILEQVVLKLLIPRKLKVKNRWWQIHWVGHIKERPDNAQEITVGYCSFDKRKIYIRKDLSFFESLSTFVHEVLHAIEFEYKIDLKHEIIYSLDEPIAKILLDNWLTATTSRVSSKW